MEPVVKIRKLDERAHIPAYATSGSAAADLCAVLDEPLTLQPMERAMIPTGLAIELPSADYVALIYARSGLGIKFGLTLPNSVGVIDSDYRGEVKAALINLSDKPYTVQPGERVAQLCITPVSQAQFTVVDELTETERGTGGFGSTGRRSTTHDSRRGLAGNCKPG